MNNFLNPDYSLTNNQIQYLNALNEHKYIICAAEQGEGKSLIGITHSVGDKTIIVVPSFLKYTWLKEFEKFIRPELLPKICLFLGSNLSEVTRDDWEILIVSYSMLNRIVKFNFNGVKTIIFDECQNILNPSSIRSKASIKLCKEHLPEYLLLLSGTPNKGKGKQWFNLLSLLSICPSNSNGEKLPREFNKYWDFQNMFCNRSVIKVSGREITIFDGIRNTNRLSELLKFKLFKFQRESLGVELRFKDVWVDPNKTVEEVDRELFLSYEANGVETPHMMSLKARSAEYKAKFTASYAFYLFDTFETPIIIFTDHRASQDAIYTELQTLKLRVGMVNGSVPLQHRNKIVEDFQKGKLDIYLATITSSNTGLTLHKSHNIIMNDCNWDAVENEQAYYRIYRIGQEKDCMIHNIISSSFDFRIRDNINKRMKGIKKIMDDFIK